MVTTEYDIHPSALKALYDWISLQPNLLSIQYSGVGDRIYCVFDHTPEQSATFKRQIARRVNQIDIGNNTFETLPNMLEELQSDQLLFTSDRQITKTNVGTSFVNLFTHSTGAPFFADFTGFTKMAFITLWTKVGTGSQHLRIFDDSGTIPTDLINTETLGGGTGLVTGDNSLSNYAIPAPYVNFKGKLRIQVRSTVAADDPVFEGIRIYLRR